MSVNRAVREFPADRERISFGRERNRPGVSRFVFRAKSDTHGAVYEILTVPERHAKPLQVRIIGGKNMAAKKMIRIRLKAYDHQLID